MCPPRPAQLLARREPADTSGSSWIKIVTVLNFVSKGPAVQQQLDAFAHVHCILKKIPLTRAAASCICVRHGRAALLASDIKYQAY